MGKLFERVAAFLIRNKIAYALLLLCWGMYILFGVKRLQLSESIYSIFPKSQNYTEYSNVLKDNSFNKQVVFSVANLPENENLKDSIVSLVKQRCGSLLTDFKTSSESDETELFNHFVKNLPALIDSNYYFYIRKRIAPDSIRLSISKTKDRLLGSSGIFMSDYLSADPLGLSWKLLQSIRPDTAVGIQVNDGNFVSADGERLLFIASLGFKTSDNRSNTQLYQKLEQLTQELHHLNPKADFEYFGAFRIAAENSEQVRHDTAVTSIISISLILLLLLIYYRSWLTPVVFVLPGIVGGLTGIASAGYIQGEISAISLGTSSVLLGIIINYSFHFFTHYRHSGKLLETVREIAQPMILGSFTTVAAFAALMFTDSVILQNFGMIALFSLTGAAIFTLLCLPPLLQLMRFRMKPLKERSRKSKLRLSLTRITSVLISGLTLFFLFNMNGIRFDENLNNLGYHSDRLVQMEKRYTGINPRIEKKLQIFVQGPSREIALEKAGKLYQQLQRLTSTDSIQEITSIAPFAPSEQAINQGFDNWNSFWKNNRNVWSETSGYIAAEGLNPDGFESFHQWISGKAIPKPSPDLLKTTGLDNLIYHSGDKWYVVSTVVIPKTCIAGFKKHIHAQSDAFILDISDLATILLHSVQADLNLLLIVSSLIVFLSLLIVYGRIELALFAFFPMIFSWIWILGISALFGIEFNFMNIVIATFIFGLGDDFSIFITDGLLQKVATGNNSLQSYRSAIVLAGITTIIGTGALIFAHHPAIHSIATLSVIGIGCVLITTLFVQPLVFNFFVIKRIQKKIHPITLINLLRTSFLYLYFFIGCTHLNALLILIYPLPFSRKYKRKIINYCVSKLAWSTIYLGFHVKKTIIQKELLDFDKPKIFVANHGSFLDILLMLMLSPKMIIVVKEWVYRSPFFGFFIRFIGYLYVADGLEKNVETVRNRLEEGYSVLIFPEGSRSPDGSIKRFHKGAFYLAQELKVDLQPILIMGAYEVIPKKDFIIRDGSITLKVLPSIQPNSKDFSSDYSPRGKDVLSYMRREFRDLYREKAKADFYRPQILSNFLFKGPVLEWYFRIKWRIEKRNYEFYDQLCNGKMNILDVGCGYGFLSYYLHLRDTERQITAIDYDEEKIAIAEHGYLKGENLHFFAADIRTFQFPKSDVVFVNDVLHYLTPEEQIKLLNELNTQLSPNGHLLIRDGIIDLEKEYRSTRLTELFSTKIFQFNKTTNELYFLKTESIKNWAKNNGFTYEMQRHSSKTSNVLFILTKN